MRRPAADEMRTIVESFLGERAPLRVTCWDGSSFGGPNAAVGITVTSPTALRRLLWNPGELGLGRAYVAGEINLNGSIFDLLALRDQIAGREEEVALHLGLRDWGSVLGSARRLGAIGLRPPPPPEEARLRGRRHRDGGGPKRHDIVKARGGP